MSNDRNILAVGCSYTKGHGLVDEEKNPLLWVNRLFQDVGKVTNIAQHGWNNESIFHAAVEELSNKNYDVVLICWSAIPRYNVNVGLEWYSTRTLLTKDFDIHINDNVTFSGKKLEKIGNSLLEFHNDHWDILNMVRYVNILIRLQVKLKKGKILFANGLGPWGKNYFQTKPWNTPDELDDYTKFILSVDTRDDNEIKEIYNKVHNSYLNAGGIQEKYWLNLYNSLHDMRIDFASNSDHHPGYQSQNYYASLFRPLVNDYLMSDGDINGA
jgi:hypothetical protein